MASPNPPAHQGGFGPTASAVIAGLLAAVGVAAGGASMPIVSATGLFAALPIFWTGLVHGPRSGIIAALVATAALALAATPAVAIVLTALVFAPAAYVSHLLNLARPADELGGPDDRLAWFPLADILFRICLIVAVATVAIAFATGYDAETARQALRDVFDEAISTAPPEVAEQFASEELREPTIQRTIAILPFVEGFVSVLVLVGNLYLAMLFARGRMARPVDDMTLALRLPTLGLLAFGTAVAVTLIVVGSGGEAFVAPAFAGAFGAGFTIAGFAILHFRLRGSPAKLPILVAVYLAAPLIFPALLALGLFSTARAVPISKRKD